LDDEQKLGAQLKENSGGGEQGGDQENGAATAIAAKK
jgi:hypothetical protein